YTHGWGASYIPIVDNEIVVTVRDNQVTNRQTLGKAGTGSVSIPPDGEGYLLALRSNQSAGASFAPGMPALLSSQSQPAIFEQYPNVMGGGPLLIRDRAIVLNPQLEGFSTNFIEGSAPRTAIGKTADGTWLIATMHDRVGGRGPTLSETAKIMQQLGAVDALNLDGGSSSSLYLGGQLLNRQPRTAARVNNGIGLFLLGQD
ncbi:MAG: phosphodiester glycosidase family protein, partial [Cyanobacteria bacterium J06560_2]